MTVNIGERMKRIWLIISAIVAVLLFIGIILNINKKVRLAVKNNGSESLSVLLNQANESDLKGNSSEAKAAYQKLVNQFPNSPDLAKWQKRIEDLNIKALFSSEAIPDKSVLYEIKTGDNLLKIAREFKTTVELIKKSNNLQDDKIMLGRQIKVWAAPFSILVDKSQNILMLKCNDEIIKTYIVSTGANNSTPLGTFKIINKIQSPTWFKAGAIVPPGSPENILGTRWLGLEVAGYGIHGTTEPQDLGKQVTQGCVRMGNSDVEEVYTIVPVGTEVTIID